MNKSILVIEDNEQNMYLIRFLLEKNGYCVTGALSAAEGIKIFPEVKPDAVLLDIQLPDTDGYTVARSLRKMKESENVPIIAVTSYAMTGDREKALESGCTGYIEKPINPDTFIGQMRAYMNGCSERGDKQ
jgi:CheY-like chemotaxis protein